MIEALEISANEMALVGRAAELLGLGVDEAATVLAREGLANRLRTKERRRSASVIAISDRRRRAGD